MSVSATAIKELRDKTGAGMLDCRAALTESGGVMEKAEGLLRQRGVAMAEKKAGRETRQGLVEAYIHPGGRFGALVEVNCETDFAARTDTFKALARALAVHISATNPRYVALAAIPPEELQAKKEQLRREALAEGKPETVVEQIVEGQLKKY